jgi:hypothetical protein
MPEISEQKEIIDTLNASAAYWEARGDGKWNFDKRDADYRKAARFKMLATKIDSFFKAIEIASQPEWKFVADGHLPDEQKQILFYFVNEYKNRVRCFGFYTRGGQIDDENSDEGDFLRDGFWEQMYESETVWHHDGVVAWMYYPELLEK